jgi:hypothetical protein
VNNGSDVFLGDGSTTKIIGRGRVNLLLKDGRIRTLPKVLHILNLPRNLIFVNKMSDASVHTVFEKETCKMVRGATVLMSGVWIGTLYKLLRSTINDGCNSYIVLEGNNEEDKTSAIPTMLWHQRLGYIREKGLRALHGKVMVEGMSDFSLHFDLCEQCIYGKQN